MHRFLQFFDLNGISMVGVGTPTTAVELPMIHGRHNARRSLYEQWVRQHGSELFGFAYRMCGDREVAEDLVQEAFYEAWKDMRTLKRPDRARAWLYQILRHRYSRWRRAEQRGRPIQLDSRTLDQVNRQPSSTPTMDSDVLQEGLDRLSDRLKVPLLLVFMQGLTCEQTATHLQVPLGTVLSRIHRAKRRLRDHLRESGDVDAAASPQFRIGGAQ